MTIRSWSLLAVVCGAVLGACTGSFHVGARVGARREIETSTPEDETPTQGETESAAEQEQRIKVQQALGPQLCTHMGGKLLSLPGIGVESNAVTGIWALHECQSEVTDVVELSFGGPGYQWVRAEQSGCKVEQTLFFEAYVRLRAKMDFTYDPSHHKVKVSLVPLHGPENIEIRAEARGEVSPEGWLGLCSLGRDQVRAKVKETLQTELSAKLSRGFEAAVSLNTLQTEIRLLAQQSEATGQATPVAPFAEDPSRLSLFNAQVIVAKDQPMFLGPFSQSLPIRLESTGLQAPDMHVLCSSVVTEYLSQKILGRTVRVPQGQVLTPSLMAQLPQRSCGPNNRAVLMLLPQETRALAGVHLSVNAEDYLADMITRGEQREVTPTQTVEAGALAQPASFYRLVIERVVVFERKPDGSSWDAMGGAVDPMLVMRPRSMSAVELRLPTDRHVSEPRHAFAERFAFVNFPIELELMDIDLTVNDFVGRGSIVLSVESTVSTRMVELQQQGRTTARVYYKLLPQL